jgi:hypothetical protein
MRGCGEGPSEAECVAAEKRGLETNVFGGAAAARVRPVARGVAGGAGPTSLGRQAHRGGGRAVGRAVEERAAGAGAAGEVAAVVVRLLLLAEVHLGWGGEDGGK